MPSTAGPVRIIHGAAAAVVHHDDVVEDDHDRVAPETTKFVVHSHVELIDDDDTILLGYLADIHRRGGSVATSYPAAASFRDLATTSSIADTTRAIAEDLAARMAHKNANRGIVFGCVYELSDGSRAHGMVKVDLDATQRFHFARGAQSEWTLSEVRDILPPPKQDFAKFIIAPQPGGEGAAGVRDESSGNESAADYLLEAAGLTVPRTRGTRARVAKRALKDGQTLEAIHQTLQSVTEDTPTEQLFDRYFPTVKPRDRAAAGGSTARPMPTVRADDPYVRIWSTRSPHFRLEAGPEVQVRREGRRIFVELPPESDDVAEDVR